ncbi:MAG: YitT family protein [Clostridia bacterium]|nr:YitT family protein [Clostridia bacterium]
MKPYDKPIKKLTVTTLSILAGNALLAFLVAAFMIPHDILMGGTSGIGITLSRLFPKLDVSLVILVLNVVLLLIGRIALGRKFAVTTVASSLLYPAFLALFQRIPGVSRITDNALLAAVFGGVLLGVALGLVMRVGSSTGGMDVIVLILNKYTHVSVAVYVWLTDFLIIGGQALFLPMEKLLLGVLVLVLESVVLDQMMVLGKAQMQLFVVSERYEELREVLLNKLEAGVTMALIETGRLHEQRKGLICVIPQRKLYDATEMIHGVDPLAFITITKVSEVHGRGFTVARESLPEEKAQGTR